MISALRDKVIEYVGEIRYPDKTLEIGSYNVNGGVAGLFTDYIGTDMRAGPGVDLVINSHELIGYFEPHSFDTIVWLETMEHDDKFWVTMQNINHLIKTSGHLIVSAPAFDFPRHAHPSDYWRFSEDGFSSLLAGWKIKDLTTLVVQHRTIVCLAQKPVEEEGELEAAYKRIAVLEDHLDLLLPKRVVLRGAGGKV